MEKKLSKLNIQTNRGLRAEKVAKAAAGIAALGFYGAVMATDIMANQNQTVNETVVESSVEMENNR